MGHGVPEGAQITQCELVSYCMPNILRGSTNVLGGTARACHLVEVWTEGKAGQGAGVRHVRRELGQGDLAKRRMDIPSQWHQPLATQHLKAVQHVQRHGGGGLLSTKTQRNGN